MARNANPRTFLFTLLVALGLASAPGFAQQPPGQSGSRTSQSSSSDKPAVDDDEPSAAPTRSATVLGPGRGYIIGSRDVISVTVWNQPTLSGKFNVDAEGMIAYPLLGRVKAGGRTAVDLEKSLTHDLADGYLPDPQVSVAVEEFRSQRLFVVGEVGQPGPYALSGRMTLIELLALVRSTTREASKEAILVRPKSGDAATGPTLPGPDTGAEIIKVDLQALEAGDLSKNIELRDGDTLFVPRAETVTVFGQVRSPGIYPISKSTTIVQLLAQAGGVTDRGASNRIKIRRNVNGKQTEFTAKLEDAVKPKDIIIVPERMF